MINVEMLHPYQKKYINKHMEKKKETQNYEGSDGYLETSSF